LSKAREQGCLTQNGLIMLHTQAEKAWEIWNT
jgi:shikimate dehydrogenase